MELARLPALFADPAAAPGRVVLSGGRLFDGTGAAPVPRTSVLVQDGLVAGVGPETDAAADNTVRVDLAGKTIMPGIVNCHIHAMARLPRLLTGAEQLSDAVWPLLLARQLRDMLRMGVTTVRDMGTIGDQVLVARQAMRYGAFRGPRLLTCGKIISATAPGGAEFAGMYREADGADEVRKAVREQIRRGADFIKVMSTGARSVELEAGLVTDPCGGSAGMPLQLTRQEMQVAVDEAWRMGYRVAAHAEGLAGCEAAVELGIQTVEHGMYLHQRPDLLAAMAERDLALVPTFSSSYWMAGRDEQIGVDGEGEGTWAGVLDSNAHANIAHSELTLRAAARAGTPIVLGGDGMHEDGGAAAGLEILRMIHHGLPAVAALVASTSAAARAIGLGHLVGTVATGMAADLVIVDGDPVAHPELLADRARIWLVMQAGRPVGGAALEVGLGDLAAG
jgi:imidazolonepropionase-like amidohydrolase